MAKISGWDLSLDVEDIGTNELPQLNMLGQNRPNPFNLSTKINFDLPKASDVTLEIYDILGEKVVSLIDDYMASGVYTVGWDGLNQSNEVVASGVYLYRLNVNGNSETRKMQLLK